MKNLPDDELFKALENRLRNYSELPEDESWDKIASVIQPAEPAWILWTNRAAGLAAVISLLLLLYGVFTNINSSKTITDSSGATGKESDTHGITTPNTQTQKLLEKVQSTTLALLDANENTATVDLKKEPLSRGENQMTGMVAGGVVSPHENFNQEISAPQENGEENLTREGVKEIQNDSTTEMAGAMQEDSTTMLVTAQVKKSTKPKRSRMNIYAIFTPSLSFQHVSPISNDEVVVQQFNSPPVVSTKRLGVSFELGVEGTITKRFQYVAGLSFYHQSTSLSYEEQASNRSTVEHGQGKEYVIKPGTIDRSFDYSMFNLGGQAGILYVLHEHKLIHKAGILLQYQQGLKRADEDDVYNNSASRYLNYQLLYRVEYTIKTNISIFFQPVYSHVLVSDEALKAPFHLKQSRAGIGIGMRYRF